MNIQETLNAALEHHRAGRLRQTEVLCRQVLKSAPNNALALHLLGVVAHQAGKHQAAARMISQAIRANPRVPRFYVSLALVWKKLGEPDKAANCYRRALQINPGMPMVYYNLGNLLLEQRKLDDAKQVFEQAIEKKPDFAAAWGNLGTVYQSRGMTDEAISHYRTAIEHNPDFSAAHWNLSLMLLKKGAFEEGWQEYEWRWKLKRWKPFYPYRYEQPRWDGTPFEGKRLFVHDEQGIGDTLQFIRYLPQVKALGGTVIFETRASIFGLLEGFPGIDELVERSKDGNPGAEFDMYIPLLGIPALLGTNSVESIPSDTVPYLKADPGKVKEWKKRVTASGLKVGVVWAGNPLHSNDRNRSCAPELFKALADIPKVSLYGLQIKDERLPSDEELKALNIDNIGSDFGDFSDTAAAIENMDLLITVDTSVVHLAGAMGKETWVLIPYANDWRWLLERDDNPWYPDIRLFRQQALGDWDELFARVATALKERVPATRTRSKKASTKKSPGKKTSTKKTSATKTAGKKTSTRKKTTRRAK